MHLKPLLRHYDFESKDPTLSLVQHVHSAAQEDVPLQFSGRQTALQRVHQLQRPSCSQYISPGVAEQANAAELSAVDSAITDAYSFCHDFHTEHQEDMTRLNCKAAAAAVAALPPPPAIEPRYPKPQAIAQSQETSFSTAFLRFFQDAAAWVSQQLLDKQQVELANALACAI